MIPYAILMLHMTWENNKTLQIRVIDPTADGVSFRVFADKRGWFEEKPSQILVHFLDYDNKVYKSLPLKDYDIREIALDEKLNAISYELIPIDGSDESYVFHELMKRELKAYGDYIKAKQSLSEVEVMEQYTDVKLEEVYSNSLTEWRAKHLALAEFEALRAEQAEVELSQVEVAVSLDTPELLQSFMQMKWEDFLLYYWELNGLAGHFISELSVTHVYLGNQFSYPYVAEYLQANIEVLLEACLHKGVEPVLVLSTMAEHEIASVRELLTKTYEKMMGQPRPQASFEVVVNDLGIAMLVQDLVAEGSVAEAFYRITGGVLLTKRKKDPRMVLRKGHEKERMAYRSTSVDASFYRAYLKKRFGITSLSYETCGYPIEIGGECDVLHMPLYQTNTGRAFAEKEIYYPDDWDLIGRWNSTFGISPYEINDKSFLNVAIMCGVHRLVVRL